MAYEVYYHKQQSNGVAESPAPNIGMTQAPSVSSSDTLKAISIGTVAAKMVPVINAATDNLVTATGDSRLKRTVKRIKEGISFGLSALASAAAFGGPVGIAVAVGGFAVSYGIERITSSIEERRETTKQEYRRKLQGSSINQLNSGGSYYG